MPHFDWVPLARAALAGFSWLASRTVTPIDDAAVSLLDSQLDNPAFVDFINSLIPHAHDEHELFTAAASIDHGTLKADLERAGIDWQKFVKETLPAILKLISLFAGK